MTYYQLPSINYNITAKNIKINFGGRDDIDIYINDSLNKYLKIAKGKISEYPEEWRQKKKFTNPYEFIHTNIPSTCMSISKMAPLSRAFFKMIEIAKIFNIFEGLSRLTSFHLAEGPGGFIEAFVYIGQMGRGESTPMKEKLPDGWINFGSNSVTYNLAKHVCNLSK